MPIRACIFDMDDLLVRSGVLWHVAEQALFAHLGAQWSADLARNYIGMNWLDVASKIHKLLQPPTPLRECQLFFRERLLEQFTHSAAPMPGAVDLVRHLYQHYPLALASGSPIEAIEVTLQRLQIRDCFQKVISSESVKRGKPHPDVFLAVADLLKIVPADCVVFEDSLVGVQAASAAGMQCYAVPSCHPEKIAQIATRVFASLAEVIPVLPGAARESASR